MSFKCFELGFRLHCDPAKSSSLFLNAVAIRTAPIRGLLFAIHTGVRNFQTISI